MGNSFTKENPNEAWVGDTSEIIVQQNKYYVCVILDLYSRKAIAHRVSYKNNANLVCNTLKDAYESRNEPKDVIFHSDQGTPYTSFKYMQLMKSLHIVSSFSRTARPLDNAVVESFFSFLKKEETHRHDYESLDDLSKAIDRYIEFYNDFRPHSHLNGKTPNEFEENYHNNKDLSA